VFYFVTKIFLNNANFATYLTFLKWYGSCHKSTQRTIILSKKEIMAPIINTLKTVNLSSRNRNKIMQILVKMFLLGMIGYAIFIFSLIGSFYVISNLFAVGTPQIESSVLIFSSIGYLVLYFVFLVNEMKINNFIK
jgi:hypothetical protein